MSGEMWWFTHDPGEFLEVAGEFLASDPLQFTVMTTVASRAVAERRRGVWEQPTRPYWFGAWRDADGKVQSAAMRSAPFEPYPLWLVPMEDEAARALAGHLLDEGGPVAASPPFGINGALEPAHVCAAELAERWGSRVEVGLHSRLFRCDEVAWPAEPEGRLRLARESDLALVVDWFEAFHHEADEQAGRTPSPGAVSQITPEDARQRVVDARVWLWERDGEVVHLTAAQLPSYGVVRIGPVFTPAEHRGQGYAARAVAVLTQQFLDESLQPCLFTDQANPVSNAVYQRIGYTPVVDTIGLTISG